MKKINQREFWIACARKNVPAAWVANQLGIHSSRFSRILRGWEVLPEKIEPKLVEILEVSSRELFTEVAVEGQ